MSLFESTGKVAYLGKAVTLGQEIVRRFADTAGGFFSTEAGSTDLLVRMKDDYDGAEPSGNSLATDLFLRLADLLGNREFRGYAERAMRQAASKLAAQPTMMPQMMCAVGRSLKPPEHVVIRVADDEAAKTLEVQSLLRKERTAFRPFLFAFVLNDKGARELSDVSPFLAGLGRTQRITIYRCENMTCQLPEQIA